MSNKFDDEIVSLTLRSDSDSPISQSLSTSFCVVETLLSLIGSPNDVSCSIPFDVWRSASFDVSESMLRKGVKDARPGTLSGEDDAAEGGF
jgi:hypothetical protein